MRKLLAFFLAWGVAQAVHAEVRNPHGVAVIVGNKHYPDRHVADVEYADRDAAAFGRYAVEVLGFDPEKVKVLNDAKERDLLYAFGRRGDRMSDLWALLDPEGRSDVVVYYSGHGVPGLDDGKGYLLPVDVPARSAQEDGYPIELLYGKLGELARGEGGRRARSVRVYLDACFSGLSYAGPLIRGASPVIIPAALPEGVTEKVTVLSAAGPRQIANWDERAKHGLFTHHLLDALYGKGDADGDGAVTAAEARRYLDDHMTPAAWLSRRSGQRASLLTRSDGAVLSTAPAGGFPARPSLDGGPGGADTAAKPGGEDGESVGGAGGGSVERDMYVVGMDRAFEAGDHPKVLAFLEKLDAVGGGLPARAGYFRGAALFHAGRGAEAAVALKGYVRQAGREGKHYRESLGLLLELDEAERERLAREEAARKEAERERAEREKAERARKEAAGREAARAPGEVFRDCDVCPEMVVLPSGSFRMGSPSSEANRRPVRRVRIGYAFAVGKYEVRRGEYGRFVSETGHVSGDACWVWGGKKWEERSGYSWKNPGFDQSDDHPVVCVSWKDAKSYVGWLSRKAGKEYRLLSESEWEYAARAGTTGPFHTGGTISTDQANYNGNYVYGNGRKGVYREKTVPAGSFGGNGFGLHDMHGNVWEWVEDCYNESYAGAPSDGSAWESGDCGLRGLRGGSWVLNPGLLRSVVRYRDNTGIRSNDNGFRVTRTLAR